MINIDIDIAKSEDVVQKKYIALSMDGFLFSAFQSHVSAKYVSLESEWFTKTIKD